MVVFLTTYKPGLKQLILPENNLSKLYPLITRYITFLKFDITKPFTHVFINHFNLVI